MCVRLPGFEGGRGVRRGAFPIICLIDLGESVWWLTGGLGGPDVIWYDAQSGSAREDPESVYQLVTLHADSHSSPAFGPVSVSHSAGGCCRFPFMKSSAQPAQSALNRLPGPAVGLL